MAASYRSVARKVTDVSCLIQRRARPECRQLTFPGEDIDGISHHQWWPGKALASHLLARCELAVADIDPVEIPFLVAHYDETSIEGGTGQSPV